MLRLYFSCLTFFHRFDKAPSDGLKEKPLVPKTATENATMEKNSRALASPYHRGGGSSSDATHLQTPFRLSRCFPLGRSCVYLKNIKCASSLSLPQTHISACAQTVYLTCCIFRFPPLLVVCRENSHVYYYVFL